MTDKTRSFRPVTSGGGTSGDDTGAGSGPRIGLSQGDLVANTYRIEREVARGGMGALFEGRHDITGARVAIKAVLEQLAGDPRAVTMFEREAIALSKVRHPAIVGYRDILRDAQQRLFIIMDFVDGKPLSHFVGRAHLPPAGVMALARRLAQGLAAAHTAGVTHRDISPKNVLLPDDDIANAVIIDFGIAKHMNADGHTVIGESFAGTLSHAAPEQLGLFGGVVDQRADIYALGIVLAEAAGVSFGATPNVAEAVLLRREDLTLPDGMEPGLRSMLAPMLRADPALRPRTMAEAVLDFKPAPETVVEGGFAEHRTSQEDPDDATARIEPGAAPADSAITRIQEAGGAAADEATGHKRSSRVNRVLAIGAAAACLLLIVGLGLLFREHLPAGLLPGTSEHPSIEQARAIVEDDTRSVSDKVAAAKTLAASGEFEQLDVAFGVFLKLARDGDSGAALEAAKMYDPNFHSARTSPLNAPNTRQALRWYRSAAQGGLSEADSHIRRLEGQ